MITTGRDDAFADGTRDPGPGIRWSTAAEERLARVPNFVRGMVKKIYADYAKERGLVEITAADAAGVRRRHPTEWSPSLAIRSPCTIRASRLTCPRARARCARMVH